MSEGRRQIACAKLEVLQQNSFEFGLLSALLRHAPTDEGVNVIATDIIAASAHPDGLKQLADFYKTGLLLPMRAGGRTPRVSYHPSRDQEIQSEAEAIARDLETAKRDQGILKRYALRRDGYRCVVTHKWDKSSLSIPSVWAKFDPTTDFACMTQAAHILPFSLMNVDTDKNLFKKTISDIIASFTGIEFKELNGDNVNSLTNVMTLATCAHEFFGSLDLWFEAVPNTSNTYKIKQSQIYYLTTLNDDTEVTFTSSDPEMLPLPDPRYLAFHAAIAKVVHTAGMAEHLDHIIQDYENIRVLSDESNLEYLDGLLRAAQRWDAS